jgi:hypothetical protein
MGKRAKSKQRRQSKRAQTSLKRRDAHRIRLYGVTHLGFAIYGDAYDPAIHGTPY